MRRRNFLAGAATAALACPLRTRGQSGLPLVGFLSSRSPGESSEHVAAFRDGLLETGHIEHRTVAIAWRWAEGDYNRLPALAADLLAGGASVIAAAGGNVSALAAKAATATVPIVFIVGSDPVGLGLVESLNRPGGNATGVSIFTTDLAAKRLQLLRELLPAAATVALLTNPNYQSTAPEVASVSRAAEASRLRPLILPASNDREIDAAFASIAQQKAEALLVGADSLFVSRRERIVALAARHAIPAIYDLPDYVAVGGLMSYGSSLSDTYRRVGTYVGRVLKGVSTRDLPVEQSVKIELVVNLKAAQSVGLMLPPNFLARADKVLE